jgi:hypothetical protein
MVNALARGAVLAAVLSASATPLYGQDAGPKWQIEIHAGGALGGTPRGVQVEPLPAGEPMSSLFGGPSSSRAVSSWYFGGGAQLLTQANAALGLAAGIMPLDGALTAPLVERGGGGVLGLRVSRTLSPRFALEFSVDRRGAPRLRDSAVQAIESASASFVAAWTGLLTIHPVTSRTISSTTDIAPGAGSELTMTGALRVRLPGTERVRPYLTGGGGAVHRRGTTPAATLTGNYSFLFTDFFPYHERDVVAIRVEQERTVLVGLFGGGVEYDLGARHGLRADVRLHVYGGGVETVVQATPSREISEDRRHLVSTVSIPSVQFNNNNVFTHQPSSLSGPPLELVTVRGSGTAVSTGLTIGYFLRF